MRAPKTLEAWAMGSLPSVRGARGRGYGFHDVLVARAAAQVARDRDPDLFLRRVPVLPEELVGRQDHAGRAETALEPVVVLEGLLNRVHASVGREAFNRHNLRAVGLDGEHRAGLDRVAVHKDRARAAVARVAPHVG